MIGVSKSEFDEGMDDVCPGVIACKNTKRIWNDGHWEGVRTVSWQWHNESDDGVAAAGVGGSQKQVPSG